MFKKWLNKIRGIYILQQYYQNKIDLGNIKAGSIWSKSKYQPVYICLQYSNIMIDTASILNRKIFKPYYKKELSDIVLGCVYKNGDPEIPYMRYIETPNFVGEVIGIRDYEGYRKVEDMDFLIRRNLDVEKYLFK